MNYFFDHLWKAFRFPIENPVLIFSLILFIILLSPILLRKIKIPSIIGLIISGVIIGPKGLNLIGEKLLESSGSVKLFSTIGLLYIMFMAGLELDMNQFKKHRNKSLTFGILTFSIPMFLGFPICYYGLNLSITASLLTASMFATHTLVAYPIVSKFGINKKSAVAVAVGGTILTDTAVLILLAVITGAAKGELSPEFWIRLLTSLTIFSLIMFLIIPRIARWFLSKLESEKTSHYIFVLSIVFFAAFLAEVAGIEHIIGAFVAGLVLNKLIPHTSTLMNRIEFIGNALFIPFFLISVGMIVDLRVLFQGNGAIITAAVLTTFAVASKWLAALATQLIYKMTRSERQIIFGLSTAHAAATLAIIIVGYNTIIGVSPAGEPIRLLNENILNATVILILVTCMIASFATENAGRKILLEQSEDEDMTLPEMRSQHLLVAINELKGNEKILDLSVLITDKKVANPISVVSVFADNQEAENNIRRSRNHLNDIVKHYLDGETQVNTMVTIDHNISSGIARTSKELAADIVIINDSKQVNLLHRIVGDEREHLLDVCYKTVFFCRLENAFVSKKRIVLICPIMAELENSFSNWLERILRLATELNIPILVFSSSNTYDKIQQYIAARKFMLQLQNKEISELDDYFLHNHKMEISDLVVFCSARNGAVSHSSSIELFMLKLGKAFPTQDRILVYPSQMVADNAFNAYEDFSNSALTKGVETIQKLGKEVGSIFKNK